MFTKTIKHYKMLDIVTATFPVNFLMRQNLFHIFYVKSQQEKDRDNINSLDMLSKFLMGKQSNMEKNKVSFKEE